MGGWRTETVPGREECTTTMTVLPFCPEYGKRAANAAWEGALWEFEIPADGIDHTLSHGHTSQRGSERAGSANHTELLLGK